MKTAKLENNLDDVINEIATLQYEIKSIEHKYSDSKNRKEYLIFISIGLILEMLLGRSIKINQTLNYSRN